MTNRQYKICRAVVRYKYLGKVLAKTRVGDYLDLQIALTPDALIFADSNLNDDTFIALSDEWAEDFENRRRSQFDRLFTNLIAILALIISAVSLLSQIGLIQLPQYPVSQPAAIHDSVGHGL